MECGGQQVPPAMQSFVLHTHGVYQMPYSVPLLMWQCLLCACSCCAELGDIGAHKQQDHGCQGVLTTARLSQHSACWGLILSAAHDTGTQADVVDGVVVNRPGLALIGAVGMQAAQESVALSRHPLLSQPTIRLNGCAESAVGVCSKQDMLDLSELLLLVCCIHVMLGDDAGTSLAMLAACVCGPVHA